MLQVRIRVGEQVDESWADWFSGLTLSHTELGETVLAGLLADRAALYGVLTKVRDLGLSLNEVLVEEHGHGTGGEQL